MVHSNGSPLVTRNERLVFIIIFSSSLSESFISRHIEKLLSASRCIWEITRLFDPTCQTHRTFRSHRRVCLNICYRYFLEAMARIFRAFFFSTSCCCCLVKTNGAAVFYLNNSLTSF